MRCNSTALRKGQNKSCGCLNAEFLASGGARRQHRYCGPCDCGDHVFATLTKGFVGLLSPDDAHWFQSRSWHAHRYQDGYWGMKGWASKKLHRLLLGLTDPKTLVDHRNGNSFDNRRHNLRICTNAANVRNQKGHRDKMYSKYKGVSRYKDSKRNARSPWCATIQHNRQRMHLGVFATAREAALAYDEAALRLHGEFARTNAAMGLL